MLSLSLSLSRSLFLSISHTHSFSLFHTLTCSIALSLSLSLSLSCSLFLVCTHQPPLHVARVPPEHGVLRLEEERRRLNEREEVERQVCQVERHERFTKLTTTTATWREEDGVLRLEEERRRLSRCDPTRLSCSVQGLSFRVTDSGSWVPSLSIEQPAECHSRKSCSTTVDIIKDGTRSVLSEGGRCRVNTVSIRQILALAFR